VIPDPAPIPRRNKPLICESVYAETEQDRFNKECKATFAMFYDKRRRWFDQNGFDEYMKGVVTKRGQEGANRLRKGVNWLLERIGS